MNYWKDIKNIELKKPESIKFIRRKEVQKKYNKLKDKRGSKEWEFHFLKYLPAEIDTKKNQEKKSTKKKRKTIKKKKTKKRKRKTRKKKKKGLLKRLGF